MRKVSLFIVAFLFTAGMAFAQNTATIDQQDDNHDAEITQESLGRTLVASITQLGVGDLGNEAIIFQEHRVGTGSARNADIYQDGDDNFATIQQLGNSGNNIGRLDATIRQEGDGNDAGQFQTNRVNDADIQQYGNNNVATQAQDMDLPENWDEGTFHNATIYQLGDDNEASQAQDGFRNTADIRQEGNDNLAEQVQFGVFGNDRLFANIDQYGSFNDAFQDQYGSGHQADIFQTGDNNWAEQTQVGSDNTALITQTAP